MKDMIYTFDGREQGDTGATGAGLRRAAARVREVHAEHKTNTARLAEAGVSDP